MTWNSSYPWDFTDTWGITQYANDGYPFLRAVGVGADLPTNYDLFWTDSGNYDTTFAGGTGTESDPYLISTARQLAGLAYEVDFAGNHYSGVYFKQTADIDVSAYWWNPIGTDGGVSKYFSGHYDGDGHTVSGVFTSADSTDIKYKGLFGSVIEESTTDRAEISNLGVINSYIQGTNYVGGIVGYTSNARIINCYNTGIVVGDNFVGGVVGENALSAVNNSYNTGDVIGSSSVGGVVGWNYVQSTVNNSYNIGNVTGSSSVGGVVGNNQMASTVNNSYNIGNVTGNDDYVGGVVGCNSLSTVSYCYYGGNCASSVGGINGSDVDGQAEYLGTITTDAKTSSWYTSTSGNWDSSYPWDFTYVWALDSSVNDGYPHFKEITVTYHSNFGDDETIEKAYYASSVDILSSDTFTREHYEIASWNTNQTGTGTSYTPGETYQIATDINLYAQWQGVLYNITLNHGNGNTNNVFYVRFDTGFYSDSGATTEITSITEWLFFWRLLYWREWRRLSSYWRGRKYRCFKHLFHWKHHDLCVLGGECSSILWRCRWLLVYRIRQDATNKGDRQWCH